MMNIAPNQPPFIFSYWRPWKENSSVVESYLDYVKDISLAKYSADIIGEYIDQASNDQINAISDLSNKIGMGISILANKMTDIDESLLFLNKKLDIQIEQKKTSNLLLENICELLRVPDSEKERQRRIELGLKFFVEAKINNELFDDALEELKKAEALMKQDYFVLHRIGLIYMYSLKHINVERALDYFTRAAKYASVESDPKASRLSDIIATYDSKACTKSLTDTSIKYLVADSREKAAFAAYVLGNFELAVKYQAEAVDYKKSAESCFFLAKYCARTKQIDLCIKTLEDAIDDQPSIALAVFQDLDLLYEPKVLNLIEKKNNKINKKIHNLIEKYKSFSDKNKSIADLNIIINEKYDTKIEKFYELDKNLRKLKSDQKKKADLKAYEHKKLINDCLILIKKIQSEVFVNLTPEQINELINKLECGIDKSFEVTKMIYQETLKRYNKERLAIGSKYFGGIVFYIDETGAHGLIAAEEPIGVAIWGGEGLLGTKSGMGEGMANTKLIVERASSKKSWFSTKPYPTAARLCFELSLNGFNDWFLPSISELSLLLSNIQSIRKKIDKDRLVFHSCVCPCWSSTEMDSDNAYYYFPDNSRITSDHPKNKEWYPNQHKNNLDYPGIVLAIRNF